MVMWKQFIFTFLPKVVRNLTPKLKHFVNKNNINAHFLSVNLRAEDQNVNYKALIFSNFAQSLARVRLVSTPETHVASLCVLSCALDDVFTSWKKVIFVNLLISIFVTYSTQ